MRVKTASAGINKRAIIDRIPWAYNVRAVFPFINP